MVLMCAAFRDRIRRALGDADPEPSSAGSIPSQVETADGDSGDGEAGEWLAYELHEWSLESRVMLQQLLVVDKVVHSWQGTTLMVHESLEETVDSLVDEVEETERAKEATTRPIGPEDALTAFELAEWPEALRAELVELLVQARVPHILDTEGEAPEDDAAEGRAPEDGVAEGDAAEGDAAGGDAAGGGAAGRDAAEGDAAEGGAAGRDAAEGDAAGRDAAGRDAAGGGAAGRDAAEGDAAGSEVCDLLVREADEERVELLIDDLLAREEEAQFEELEGLEVNDLLSAMFVACDRLRRDPGALDGVRGVVMNGRRIAGVRTPFGFSASSWRDLRNAVGEMLELVEGGETDREDLRELAHRMSDTLRRVV